MSVVIEKAIIQAIGTKIAAITPRHEPRYPFKEWARTQLETVKQPNIHRWFQIVWGDSIELAPNSGIERRAEFERQIMVAVTYRIQGQRVDEAEPYFACDVADIIGALTKDGTIFSAANALASDGQLFYIEPLTAQRTWTDQAESAMHVVVPFAIRYTRELT